jgi:hypothetical protein
MRYRPLRLIAIIGSIAAPVPTLAAPITINSFGAAYTQDFNSLGNIGTTNAALPAGWTLLEAGSSARVNQQYAAGNGSDSAGDVYSFGSSGSSERALGTLLSNTLTPTIGASFVNKAGGTLTALAIAYTGEQWRLGVADRGAADRLAFQYSLNASSLDTGTWINVNALDFSSPDTTGVSGARDGNAAADRTSLAATITGLSVADGATFWIRWSDFDISNADDGLAVDDFSLKAHGVSAVPEPGTLGLLGIGIALAGIAASRRSKQ